ncbi:origin recognition complex, subunit 4 [Hesseltinella vesiculosa]|uniref:Origin recognition complex subunit 4 n=1 Tax=Hesseltinella vesiculosa TaxID=101127 RepID=A0A1X2GG94_9FUNG|nr:origin recognition complex, subunit 4 [Hesseltinella vesiculosa]
MTKRAQSLNESPAKRPHLENENLKKAKKLLMSRLSEDSLPTQLRGLQAEYDRCYKLLEQTIVKGESNSCLLIGNRGTGKTALTRMVIDDLTKNLTPRHCHDFSVIRLNGLTETTDRLAINEIARQLSHVQYDMSFKEFTSFAESFEYTLSLLKQGDRSTLPLVFILEEFDLFAQHPKQSLLYTLFDATQSAQNPMAVIGLSCRIDALNLLEKRVKSRFSHRQIYLYPVPTFADFLAVAQDTLTLPDDLCDSSFVQPFNEAVQNLFQDDGINRILRRMFDITKDFRLFYKICFEPVSMLTDDAPFFQAQPFVEVGLEHRKDSKTEMLKGVSLLELVLIVSMKKLMEKDIVTFNFQMVYDEYKTFMTQTQVRGMGFGMKLYKRQVALKAFESLQSFELVCPVEKIGKCPKEFRMAKLMLEQAQITEAVLRYKDCPTNLTKWATGAA